MGFFVVFERGGEGHHIRLDNRCARIGVSIPIAGDGEVRRVDDAVVGVVRDEVQRAGMWGIVT